MAYNSGNQNRDPIEPTAFDEMKLRLRGDRVDGSGKRNPGLSVSVVKNQPRFTVYTNVDGDKNNGRVMARMDSVNYMVFMEMFDRIIKAEPNTKYVIENMRPQKNDGGGKSEMMKESSTIVAKDSDGRIFISVVDGQVTPTKFYFGDQYYHRYKLNGKPLEKDEASVLHANAWRMTMLNLLAPVLNSHYAPSDYQKNGGGGNKNYNKGGGGGNRNNYEEDSGGSGGGGKSSASYDDDIDF